MLSFVPILALALVLQTDAPASMPADAPGPTAETAPDPADDPIGALMQQQESAAPVATAPAVSAPPPAAAAPSPANVTALPAPAPVPVQPPVQAYAPPTPAPPPPPPQGMDEDEDAEEAHASLPSAPQPYTSLPATPSVRPNAALFNNPMVRLPPAPTGSLDGGWVLSRSDGRKLYSFQFNDTGGGNEIEGAWRDLGQEWSPLGSGPVTSVGYEGSGLTIRFFEKGRTDMSVILLTRAASGDWTGEFQSKNGPTQVVMRRN